MKWFFDRCRLRNERGMAGPEDDDDDDDDIVVEDKALDDDHKDKDDDDDTKDDDITIDLDADDDDGKQTKSDKAFAEMRIENKELKKTVDEMKDKIDGLGQQQTTVVPEVTVQGDPNDTSKWTEKQWDELAKTDWKKAVDLRAEIKAKQQYTTATTTAEHNKVLEESKEDVLRRHPELGDTNSEKSKIFKNIVTSNPEYVTDKKGPIHAMYEMENYMEKNMGYKREDIVKAEKKGQEDEATRRDTVALTSTAGRNMSEGNKIVLSKDEQEFCKIQEIDPKTYATNKKKLAKSGGGGIQL